MNALDHCLRVQRAEASLRLRLDDELGTLHGLSFADFALMSLLAEAGAEGVPAAALVRPLGLQPSALLRQVIALEKTGLLQRTRDAAGTRRIGLRSPGRQLVAEAQVTANATCGAALAGISEDRLAACGHVLDALAASPALEPD